MQPRNIIKIGIFLLCAGCVEVPDFPVTPTISFNSVYFKDESPVDNIYLTINYKDGDGDLGLNNNDLLVPPFEEFIDSQGIQIPNRNHYNIFPVILRKNGDAFEPVIQSGYDGIFPRLRVDARKGPIEGTILYKLSSVNFFNQDSSIAKIRVYIQDRALRKSNIIETPPFPVIYN